MNLPDQTKHILILTGEPSGDMHGGNLVREIRKSRPDIYISGIGGPALSQEKVDLFYSIDQLSAMGITEVLLQFRQIKKAFDQFRQKLRENCPDLIIFIDYPGFNLKAAQYAKTHYSVKTLYYITPKVWAWNRSRLKKIRKYIDHAALILPFEEKIFKKAGISCTFVGNPLVDLYPATLSKPFLRHNAKADGHTDQIVIGLLPGSRKTEVHNLLATMGKAAQILSKNLPGVRFSLSKSDSISSELMDHYTSDFSDQIQFDTYEGPVKGILTRSDLVIAASGTVTLEAALCCVPTIIVYRVSRLSYLFAKLMVKVKYAGLANLILNYEVMPELLQNDATPEKISRTAMEMINRLQYYEKQLVIVRDKLGAPGASTRVARISLNMIQT